MESERPIEKVLRQYAQQRQKTASKALDLHPATRRMLQAEVARNYPRSAPGTWSWPWWMKRGWAYIVITACAAIGSTFVIQTQIGKKNSVLLAKKESISSEIVYNKDIATNIQKFEPSTKQSNLVVAMRSENSVPARGGEVASSAIVSVNVPTDAEVSPIQTPAMEKAASPASTPIALRSGAPAVSRPHPDGTPIVAASTFVPSAAGIRNVQVYANNIQTADAVANDARFAQILASFQVEQSGNSIRIVDNDGSIYSGVLRAERPSVSTANAANSAVRTRSQPTASTLAPVSVDNQNFTLEVSGTNLSLNQRVIFTGNLSVDNVVSQPSSKSDSRSAKPLAQPPLNSVLSNSRIQGQAQVGENGIVNVEAVAAQRR
jgi:hypothetical protein